MYEIVGTHLFIIRNCAVQLEKIKADIIKYESDIVINSKLYPKMLYKYLKDKMNVRDTIRPANNSDGWIVTDTKDICDIFNVWFHSV